MENIVSQGKNNGVCSYRLVKHHTALSPLKGHFFKL